MPSHTIDERQLLEKIRRLPPEKMQEVDDFVSYLIEAKTGDDRLFMRAVVQGLADLEAGRSVGLAEARKRLGLA
jgi:hypothetical protein